MTALIIFSCVFIQQVFGWDTVNNDYDRNETDGRSYISAVSEVVRDPTQTCDGRAKNTMGEARMVSCLLNASGNSYIFVLANTLV